MIVPTSTSVTKCSNYKITRRNGSVYQRAYQPVKIISLSCIQCRNKFSNVSTVRGVSVLLWAIQHAPSSKLPIWIKKIDGEVQLPVHEGQDLARAMKIYDNIGTTIPYDVLQFQSSISIVYGGNACGVKPTFSKLPRFEVLSVTPQAFELEF